MTSIHPSAIVSPKAKIGLNVTIEPYAIIQDDVIIEDETYIGPHVSIYNGARIGKQVRIFQGASISHNPQHIHFADEPTECFVGDNSTIHEFVTIHKGTKDTGKTSIGKNVLMMAYSHVAHDCKIGDNCIIANAAQIGGVVEMEEYAILGGSTPVHQFCKIGKHCMIGGGFRVVKDVPPFILAGSEPLKYSGLNSVGLRRRGFTSNQLETLKKIYNLIYDSKLNVSQAKEYIAEEFKDEPLAKEVLEFLSKAKRGIIGK